MPKYSIEVRTSLDRLWDIEASDWDEAKRKAEKATLQLQYYNEILDGCSLENRIGYEQDDPTIQRVEVYGE